jgi:hypothetical protein
MFIPAPKITANVFENLNMTGRALDVRRTTYRQLIVQESNRYYGFKWLLGF